VMKSLDSGGDTREFGEDYKNEINKLISFMFFFTKIQQARRFMVAENQLVTTNE
jgi:hypothetical protein